MVEHAWLRDYLNLKGTMPDHSSLWLQQQLPGCGRLPYSSSSISRMGPACQRSSILYFLNSATRYSGKTSEKPGYQRGAGNICTYPEENTCLILPAGILWLLLLLTATGNRAYAQHIPVTNPSLEGTPAEKAAPPRWGAVRTSDIQPGIYNVWLPPSDGSSYVGLHSGPTYVEGVSQRLSVSMKAGYYYNMSFDLAYTSTYVFKGCYGNLAIYGGHSPGDLKELLWTSGEFTHTGWKRYNASFSPTSDHKYITLCAYHSSQCNRSRYGVIVLVDNLSSWIYQRLELELSTTATCADTNTGAVSVKVRGGVAPYTYQWSTQAGHNSSTKSLSGLPAGQYQVTVTDSRGISARGTATVAVTDLASAATVTPSLCHGDGSSRISISTTGGIPPYRYYLDGSTVGTYTPVFEYLEPGRHDVLVKDEQGCINRLDNMQVKEPPPLVIRHTTVRSSSCSGAANGVIIPQVQGGVPPYEYRVDNGLWQQDSVLGQLGEGYHRYEVRDRNACTVSGTGETTSPWKNCLVVMPTAFSPNGDGMNDVFRPKVYDDIHNYQLTVYNRWGELVFRSTDPNRGWDGTYRGLLQEVQGFTYICTYQDRNNTRQELKGVVVMVQ